MKTPFESRALERLQKAPCFSPTDNERNWQTLNGILASIYNAPFVFHTSNVDLNEIVAYEDTNQLIAAPLKWAVASQIVELPAAGNGWIGIILGKKAGNFRGQNAAVKDEVFLLRGKDGQNYDLNQGDVFSYMYDSTGRRFIIDDPLDATGAAATGADAIYQENGSTVGQQPKLNLIEGQNVTLTVTDDGANSRVNVTVDVPVLWGKTQHNWKKDGTVSIKAVPGYPGSTTEVGSAFDIKIPNPNPSAYDPNVLKGKYVPYLKDDSGNYVLVGNYLDAKIKSVRMYIGDPDDLVILDGSVNISGWGWMDGNDNSTGNGGSGINAKGYYLYNKSSDTDAVSGGSDLVAAGTHTHTVTINNASGYVAIANHPDHTHRVLSHCGTCRLWECSTGQSTYLITGFTDDHTDKIAWTGIQKLYDTDHTTAHPDLTLSHSVTSDAHAHTNSVTDSHSDPNRFMLYLVERLDNSFDTLGI